MSNQPIDDAEIVRVLRPWFPLFSEVVQLAEQRSLAAIDLLGLPRKVERAGDMHRAIRSGMRAFCDEDPWFKLVEEPEGQGLDYVVCEVPTIAPFAIRFGRYNGVSVKRNRTVRQQEAQTHGVLFGGLDVEVDELSQVTLAYTVEDDYTLAGKPAWWMGRLVLLRERVDNSDFLIEVDRFVKPEVYTPPQRVADVKAREEELEKIRKIARQIRAPGNLNALRC